MLDKRNRPLRRHGPRHDAAGGVWLLRFGVAAPLAAASVIFTLALGPLMKGRVEAAA